MEAWRTRDDEGGRVETDDGTAVCREAPAMEVALIPALTSLELGGAGAGLGGSPARSTSVLRLRFPGGGGIRVDDLALLSDDESSTSLGGDGIRLG